MSDDLCPGSGNAGIENVSITENNKKFVYYRCEECGVYLPDTPLKDHLRIQRGDR